MPLEPRTVHVPGFGEVEVPPHVSRVDSGPHTGKGWHGWQVRWLEGGIRRSKWFPDRTHGGIERALEAAIDYREQRYPGRQPRSAIREDKGVTIVEKLHSNGRTVQLYAQASHPQHGKASPRIYIGTRATATPERIERAIAQAREVRRRLVEEHRLEAKGSGG
ncbi:AP2 domain-containing protein [Caldimonas tepidiphila]|uniref:AP2 domain-containing protein n=1 Tax=Caldimonas tepidiphila TaxID=2315841 RepID=UPI000E5A6892|nr:AP2 domain-containing protein [Caldimonas tepidiphila]